MSWYGYRCKWCGEFVDDSEEIRQLCPDCEALSASMKADCEKLERFSAVLDRELERNIS